MYRAIVCSDGGVQPHPAFFNSEQCWKYWYSRMKTDHSISAFRVYFTQEDDIPFYNMRATLITDCMRALRLIGTFDKPELEEHMAHTLIDLEIIQLEVYQQYLEGCIQDLHIY